MFTTASADTWLDDHTFVSVTSLISLCVLCDTQWVIIRNLDDNTKTIMIHSFYKKSLLEIVYFIKNGKHAFIFNSYDQA